MFRIARLMIVAALIAAITPLVQATAQDQSLTIFAAASLKNALDDVNAAFSNTTGVKVTTSYEASSSLGTQIEAGAPCPCRKPNPVGWRRRIG